MSGGGGVGVRAIVTHRGPTTGGRGVRAIVTHLRPAGGPMTGGGVGQIRVRPDRALKNLTVWPKAGRMAKIRGYSPECPGLTTSMLTGNR